MFYPYQENQNFDLLIQFLKKEGGNCILWIGAGISRIAGYPSWKELVLKTFNFFKEHEAKLSPYQRLKLEELKLQIETQISKSDYPDVFQQFKHINEELYIEGIQQIFKEAEKQQNNEIYFKLSPFIMKGIPIITTNIDKGLEIALRIPEHKISIIPLGKYNLNSSILYLHGRIDEPDSWILSESEYAKKYANSQEFLNFWEDFFKKYKIIIFLGYSLEERDVQRKFYKRNISLFWTYRVCRKEEEEIVKISKVIDKMERNNTKIYPITYLCDYSCKDEKSNKNSCKNEKSIINLLDYIYNMAFGIGLDSYREE